MLPPSATLGVEDSEMVVVLFVSETAVTAGAGSMARLSKLPPLVPVIVVETDPASTYTSSAGAGIDTEPILAPAAMVIAAPLDRFTVTAVPAGLVSDAV